MQDTDASTDPDRVDERGVPAVSDAVRTTESYETEAGVVFYDAENPLAWVQTDHVVDLDSAA